jgi:NADPH:quinone reductase-like Zn-dependent oxidoreductase
VIRNDNQGAYAEYIALSSKMIIHKPPHLTPVQAAGVPGASGVGGAAIQLASKYNRTTLEIPRSQVIR